MPAKAPRRAREPHDALGSRVERVIIGVLLGLTGVAATCWACTWWGRATRAEATTAPPAPAESAELASTPSPARQQTLGRSTLRVGVPGVDAGPDMAVAPERAPARDLAYGADQGHGSEGWSRPGAAEPRDFEPRYSLDAGGLAELPAVAAEATGAFH